MHSPFRGAILHAQFTGMKKITFRADERLMEQARLAARLQGKTLNSAFRQWLVRFSAPYRRAEKVESPMKRLRHIRSSGPYIRREMHEQ